MKIALKQSSLLLLMLVTFLANASASDALIEKTKNYTKTYALSGNDRVNLENSFGEMKIQTWNRNEVKVDVTITARSGSEERAQQILETIEIKDGKTGSEVWFKTDMDENKKMSNKKNNNYKDEGFTINYVVSMPSSTSLEATNSFGQMIIPDYTGAVELESKFGGLTAGVLSNVQAINVEFGKADIKKMNNGKATIKFSRGKIGSISGTFQGAFEHCSGIWLGIGSDVKSIKVKNDFTKIYMDVPKNLSADFDLDTHFGEVNNQTSFAINKSGEDDDDDGPKFDHRYTGKSGTGGVPIKVKSDFGEIVVGHDLPFNLEDDNQKDKDKHKTKAI
ncbi:MAG TPA: hypothetical protein VLC28_07265 [Flavitalea sp.]|nr:hypothetical protein [Flavitalea sp.]